MSKIFVLINEKQKGLPPITLYQKDLEEFKKKNHTGWGVFFAVNEFEATEEQMRELGVKTKRNDVFCTKLRFAYADIDIAKEKDNIPEKDRAELRQRLIFELIDFCPPSVIVETKNGVQPLWALEDGAPTEENKKKYVQIIKGVNAWTKQFGGKADNVYDLSRILRVPGFYHNKGEPFLCKQVYSSDTKYSYSQLLEKFPFQETEQKREVISSISEQSNPVFQAIREIDFQELIIKAFASVGRPVTFDKNQHLIDPVGGTTGTFQGRRGDRRYLASSSHDPFEGNEITSVAQILNITYSEAYKWICKEYNLDWKKLTSLETQKNEQKKVEKIIVKKDYKKFYTWGTRELDNVFPVIDRKDFIVVGASSGSGKTTYTFDMACKNADMGHKVLYLSLEMDEEKIKFSIARRYAGLQPGEVIFTGIPIHKQKALERKMQEIENRENLFLKGVTAHEEKTWEGIVQTIGSFIDLDMIFIDNLDSIAGQEREDDMKRQERIVDSIRSLIKRINVPVVLIHHHKKLQKGSVEGSVDEMRGSGKIRNFADRILYVAKNKDEAAVYPEKYKTIARIQKGREWDEASRAIYFIRGTFVDVPPTETEYTASYQLQQIAENFGGEIIQ